MTANNARYNLLINLENALKGIQVANGYQVDVRTVEHKTIGFENLTSDKLPALLVLDDGHETVIDDSTNMVFCEMYPTIIGYVKDKTDPKVVFGKLDSDIKKWIYSNPNLGTYCKMIQYQGYIDIQTSDQIILFEMQIKITYDFEKANP